MNPSVPFRDTFWNVPGWAQVGLYVGGIVAATTTPPPDRLTGEATIRLVDAGAFVQAPLLDGRADAFAGGRYSYTAAVLSLIAPDTRLGSGRRAPILKDGKFQFALIQQSASIRKMSVTAASAHWLTVSDSFQ